jgi:hypothetical protein
MNLPEVITFFFLLALQPIVGLYAIKNYSIKITTQVNFKITKNVPVSTKEVHSN